MLPVNNLSESRIFCSTSETREFSIESVSSLEVCIFLGMERTRWFSVGFQAFAVWSGHSS